MLRALPCVCFFKELTLYFKCSRFIAKWKDGTEFPSALDPVSAVASILLDGAAFAVSLTHHMVFRALAIPCCPLSAPYHFGVLDCVLWSCLLRVLLNLALHFLVLVALKSSGIRISCPALGLHIVLFSLSHWDYLGLRETITEEKRPCECVKRCVASPCHAVLTLNICWVPCSECVPTPVLCRQAGGMEEKERGKAGTIAFFRTDKYQNTPCKSSGVPPPSQVMLSFGAHRQAHADPVLGVQAACWTMPCF